MKVYVPILEGFDDDFRDMPSWYSRRQNPTTTPDNRLGDYEWGELVGFDLPDFDEYCSDRGYDMASPTAWENYVYYCEDAYEEIKNNR